MHVTGKVIEETKINKRQSTYQIDSDNGVVEIVANGKQALKDALFIRNGQIVEVDGELNGNVMISKKGKIIL